MTFYNTIDLPENDLAQLNYRARSQADIILSFFKAHPDREFTPFEVQEAIGLRSPITSIRRAISDLTKDGKLAKTDHSRAGKYGVRNMTWRFRNEDRGRQLSLF